MADRMGLIQNTSGQFYPSAPGWEVVLPELRNALVIEWEERHPMVGWIHTQRRHSDNYTWLPCVHHWGALCPVVDRRVVVVHAGAEVKSSDI